MFDAAKQLETLEASKLDRRAYSTAEFAALVVAAVERWQRLDSLAYQHDRLTVEGARYHVMARRAWRQVIHLVAQAPNAAIQTAAETKPDVWTALDCVRIRRANGEKL